MKNNAFKRAFAMGLFIAAAASAQSASALQVEMLVQMRIDDVQISNRVDFLDPNSEFFDPENGDLDEIQFALDSVGRIVTGRFVFDSGLFEGAPQGTSFLPITTPMVITDGRGGEINNGPNVDGKGGWSTRAGRVNDDVVGPVGDGQTRDAIAFLFDRPYEGPSEDKAPDEGLFLFAGGPGWFESYDNPLQDFDASEPFIDASGWQLREVIRSSPETGEITLYDQEIFGSFESVRLTPLGATEDAPLLPETPQNPEAPEFEFILSAEDVPEGGILWIDPDIAVGYDYVVQGGLFSSVTAPTLATVPDADGLYTLEACGTSGDLAAGQTILFEVFCDEATGFGLDAFAITGIDTGLMLDPLDPEAFVTGLGFVPGSLDESFSVTQTPRTIFVPDAAEAAVPLPAAGWLLLAGIGGLVASRRRG